MEPLWSPVVATGGNQRQIAAAHKPRKQAKSVATGCHRLPEKFHGKERVCHRLRPVAEFPLSAKEGVDLQALQRFSKPAAGPTRSLLHDYARPDTRARATNKIEAGRDRRTVRDAAKHTSTPRPEVAPRLLRSVVPDLYEAPRTHSERLRGLGRGLGERLARRLDRERPLHLARRRIA